MNKFNSRCFLKKPVHFFLLFLFFIIKPCHRLQLSVATKLSIFFNNSFHPFSAEISH